MAAGSVMPQFYSWTSVGLTMADPGSDDRTALRWPDGPVVARVALASW